MKVLHFFACSLFLISLGTSAEAFAAQKVIYEVPASLNASSVAYELTNSVLSADKKGLRTLSIQLPAELVGTAVEMLNLVEVKQPVLASFALFTDGEVSASCSEQTTGLNCVLNYPSGYLSSLVKTSDVAVVLQKKLGGDPVALGSALAAAARFASEPQGVVQVLFGSAN